MYVDRNGNLQDHPMRNIFNIVDGIVGGEGNGPLDPIPKPAGVVVTGRNPVAVDFTCARLMNFDYRRLPILHRPLTDESLPLYAGKYSDVICKSNNQKFARALSEFDGRSFAFKSHFGWQGHIELDK
jgi:uncharacterized protein (DUF362 family)